MGHVLHETGLETPEIRSNKKQELPEPPGPLASSSWLWSLWITSLTLLPDSVNSLDP